MRVLAWPASRAIGNPYNELFYAATLRADPFAHVEEFEPAKLVARRWHVWHVHWPERVVNKRSNVRAAANLAAFAFLLGLARIRGTRVVWTAHNLEAHDRLHPRWEALLMAIFTRAVDGVIALTRGGGRAVVAKYPRLARKPLAVIAHGHFADAYPRITRADARRALGIADDARVLAYVGRISAYKNVPSLIRCFRDVRADGAVLLVVGEPSDAHVISEARAAAAHDRRVRLHIGPVPDQDLSLHVAAADAVVLPFRRIQNSSSVFLALSLGRRVVVPRVGAIPELERGLGGEWIRAYDGDLTTEVLDAALASAPPSRAEAGALEATLRVEHDWDAAGARAASFFRAVGAAR